MQHVEASVAEDFARIRETQIDNVIRLLESSIGRIKISIILPRLASDLDNVEPVLRNTAYEPAINLLRRLKGLDAVNTQMFNFEVLQTIDYFQSNYKMYEMFPRYLNNVSAYDKTLLIAFETILDVAKRHLWRTSKAEINMERQLRIMYQEREETRERIEYYKKKLRSKTALLRWRRAAQFLIVEKQEADLASRKWKNNVRIQNEIEKHSQTLSENHKASMQKQIELEEELEKARAEYEKVITNNAEREKDLRAEKNKLLIQLENALHRYDSNVGEKLRENLELEDMYNAAKKELDDFMVHYRKEEAIYNRIVVQYELEEQRKQQQRIMIFMMNRAARKIQAYWQEWRRAKLKKARKAAKKGKKK
ncbi:inner centromere protein A [Drosophila montana]|uniref:inner centromere protein A n=1 Tax=Drosophila montana TaxID=40370 RepID=UPI00313D2B0A